MSITKAADRLQVHVTSVTHGATVTLSERVFAMPGYAAAQDPRDALGICKHPLALKAPAQQ